MDELRALAPPGVKLVEVESAASSQLQARHRREKSTTAATVLLVASADGRLLVVGPTADRESRVAPDSMRRLLAELREMTPLDAARHLARELPLLDDAEGGGLSVNGLGTRHVYADRIRGTARWAEFAAAARDADRSEWRALLRTLGYEIETLPREGYLGRFEGAPVVVVMARASVADFATYWRCSDSAWRSDRWIGALIGTLIGTLIALVAHLPRTGSRNRRCVMHSASRTPPTQTRRPASFHLSGERVAHGYGCASMAVGTSRACRIVR
jgi:hypothetical protein